MVRVHYYCVFEPIHCPFAFDQLHITAIEILTPGCAIMAPALLMNLVTGELLTQNPMGFEPYVPGCHVIQRVLPGTCWGYAKNPERPNDTVFVPCDTSQCCLTLYQVCIDSIGGKRTITRLPSGGGSVDTCSPTNPNVLFCHPLCSDTSGEEIYYKAIAPDAPAISRQMQGGRSTAPMPAVHVERAEGLDAAAARVMQAVPVEVRNQNALVGTRVRAAGSQHPLRQR